LKLWRKQFLRDDMKNSISKSAVVGASLMVLGTVGFVVSLNRGNSALLKSGAAEQTIPVDNRDHELKMLTAELQKKPDHTPILLRIAQLKRDSGRHEEAVRHLRAAVQKEPENTEARLELGRALYESGDIAGSVAETAKILEQNPSHVDALYNLGAIYANSGDETKAKSYWAAAVAAGPQTPGGQKAQDALRVLDSK
jgi:tetratricopeptide (TPR) repeat protein